MNLDIDPEGVDTELRATLQWIAASQLGVPTVYFRRSEERQMEKVGFPSVTGSNVPAAHLENMYYLLCRLLDVTTEKTCCILHKVS